MVCLLFLAVPIAASAQFADLKADDTFSPQWRLYHYSPDDFPVGYQLWSVTEDAAGRIYVSDQDGIRYFNGDEWTQLETPTGTTVRSLASDGGRRIFYGAQGDIGLLEANANGDLVATTIADSITTELDLGNVWGTHVVDEQIFFQAKEAVLVLSDGEFRVYESENGFHNAFAVGGRYFVRAFSEGLLEWNGDGFELLDGAEQLAEEKIFLISPDEVDASSLIVWTQDQGQFLINADGHISHRSQYPPELAEIAKERRLYTGFQTSSNGYLIGTLGAGLLHIDGSGNLIDQYSTDNGFPDDTINYIYQSESGDIWVALHNVGLAQMDHRVRVLRLGRDQGLRGHINSVHAFRSSIGIVTATGFFALDGSTFKVIPSYPSPLFNLLPGTSQAWDFHEADSTLLVAREEAISAFSYDQTANENEEPSLCVLYNGSVRLGTDNHGYLIQDVSGRGDYYVGLETGAAKLDPNSADGCRLDLIPGTEALEVRTIATDREGLWLGTRFKGVYRVLDGDVKEFPYSSKSVSVVNVGGEVLVYSGSETPKVYDAAADSLIESSIFAPLVEGGENEIQFVYEDSRGAIWVALADKIVKISVDDTNRPTVESPPALTFDRGAITSMYLDEAGSLWFNDGDELIRYEAYSKSADYLRPSVFITSVITASAQETLFNGFHLTENDEIVDQQELVPEWEYANRNLLVRVAAIDVSDGERLSFQYFNLNRDEWSDWQSDSNILVSDLDEGNHTIRVRARDSIGRISNEARFSFVLLPPWYRTWWAIVSYTLFGGLFILTSVKYVRMRHAHIKAEEQAKELERERIVVRKLQQANDRLQEANKLKDEFLATTSHELRTPLTAILGFTSVLKEEVPATAEYREFLDIIEDSGSRLMDTLNSLLDIAKLRAGTIDLNIEAVDVQECVSNVVNSLAERAEKKGIYINVGKGGRGILGMADSYALSRVIHNLVSNAIKFTDDGGVVVDIDSDSDGVYIAVTDTGVGIDDEFVPKLFSEFMQESDGLARTYEGSGLGLAISGRLAFLMGGEISVESRKGTGSTFRLSLLPVENSVRRIPTGKNAFGAASGTS